MTNYLKQKATRGAGVVQKIDSIGRLVIPSGIRNALKFLPGKELDLIMVEEGLLIRQHVNVKDEVLLRDLEAMRRKAETLEEKNVLGQVMQRIMTN